MKVIILAGLLTATQITAAEAPAPVAPESAADGPDKAMLEKAFDGAMTCSALAAMRAHEVDEGERWRWENRSFAFGMLAARFWGTATDQAMSMESLDKALNKYAGQLTDMNPEEVEPFRTSCAGKFADIDELCNANPCPHNGPPGETSGDDQAPDAPAG